MCDRLPWRPLIARAAVELAWDGLLSRLHSVFSYSSASSPLLSPARSSSAASATGEIASARGTRGADTGGGSGDDSCTSTRASGAMSALAEARLTLKRSERACEEPLVRELSLPIASFPENLSKYRENSSISNRPQRVWCTAQYSQAVAPLCSVIVLCWRMGRRQIVPASVSGDI